MEQKVLTSEQERALAVISRHPALASSFYLSGGTALTAYYLQHRYSDDLDFFTAEKEFPQTAVEAVIRDMQTALDAPEAEYRRLHDRRVFFMRTTSGELKIEFTFYPFPRLNPSIPHEGIAVDSLEDISANKLMALIDRIESKDFVDLYFLMNKKKMTIARIADLVRRKFSLTLDPLTLGSELAKARFLDALPRMIAPLTLVQLKSFFSEEAIRLKPQILEE